MLVGKLGYVRGQVLVRSGRDQWEDFVKKKIKIKK